MSEKQEQGVKKPSPRYTPALAQLLGGAGERFGGHDGIMAASMLYHVARHPGSHQEEKLYNIVSNTDEKTFWAVLDAVDDTEPDEAEEAFIQSLEEIITDSQCKDIPLKTNAVRFALAIRAWKLTNAINEIEMSAPKNTTELTSDWQTLIREVGVYIRLQEFYKKQEAEAAEAQRIKEAQIADIRDFINSLDLNDFTGMQE